MNNKRKMKKKIRERKALTILIIPHLTKATLTCYESMAKLIMAHGHFLSLMCLLYNANWRAKRRYCRNRHPVSFQCLEEALGFIIPPRM
jgi:ABC-type polysaccharide transport system permease subunit